MKQMRHKLSLRYFLAIAALLIFLLSLVAAKTGTMGTVESAVFDWAYNMTDRLSLFALIVTQFGSTWFTIGMIGLLFVVTWNPKPALTVFRNAFSVYLLTVALKLAVNRPRPVLLLDDFLARSAVAYGDGFPSGHTALATIVSLSLLPYLPRALRWLPFVWIPLVGWSRVYLGVHAPLDIVGGFCLGLLVYLLIDWLPWPKRLQT